MGIIIKLNDDSVYHHSMYAVQLIGHIFHLQQWNKIRTRNTHINIQCVLINFKTRTYTVCHPKYVIEHTYIKYLKCLHCLELTVNV